VKAAAAARRSAVINADTALRNAQDRLLSLVVGPAFTAEAGAELIPQDYPQLGEYFLEYDHEVATALQMRPEVYITVNQMRSASVNLRVARNDLLPRLDAFLETYVAGLRGDSDVFGAIQDQYREGEPGYSVGLRYEVPFGRRAAKARNSRARLELQQLEDSFQALVADISVDVRTAVREIERLKADLLARNNQLLRAVEELRYLEARYELKVDRDRTGSLYLEDLLGSQQRLFEAESALLRSQTELAVAIADMQRANGMLLRVEGNRTLPMDICNTAQPIAAGMRIDSMTGAPLISPVGHVTQ
jgi:outer membrane protein TolC